MYEIEVRLRWNPPADLSPAHYAAEAMGDHAPDSAAADPPPPDLPPGIDPKGLSPEMIALFLSLLKTFGPILAEWLFRRRQR